MFKHPLIQMNVRLREESLGLWKGDNALASLFCLCVWWGRGGDSIIGYCKSRFWYVDKNRVFPPFQISLTCGGHLIAIREHLNILIGILCGL